MPELPDIVVYVDALRSRLMGRKLTNIRIASPFLLRSFEPSVDELNGRMIVGVTRLGKRIVIALDGELWIVLHLMIVGRLHWKPAGTKLTGKHNLAALDFDHGTLTLTEAGSKRRASMYVVQGNEQLAEHDPGGLNVLEVDERSFAAVLVMENRTLKRALTNPRMFDGIGNAYSDEILHAAKLSPLKRTNQLDDDEIKRLYKATRDTLAQWIGRLRAECGDAFPEKVTAFRNDMSVHGRFGKPCPDCGSPVQRIVYAQNESNYCATCQIDGRVLADRSLSKLLRDDWPRTIEQGSSSQASQTITNLASLRRKSRFFSLVAQPPYLAVNTRPQVRRVLILVEGSG